MQPLSQVLPAPLEQMDRRHASPGPTAHGEPTTPPSRQYSPETPPEPPPETPPETPPRPRPHPFPGKPGCPRCGGIGWHYKAVALSHADFGKAFRCPCNRDFRPQSGLNESELALSEQDVHGSSACAVVLRCLVPMLIAEPKGMLCLWGPYGTGKTATAQAIVAGLIRRQQHARYIHAKALEQTWFRDMDAGTNNGSGLRTAPTLAIDEMDKVNLKSDWVKQQFQELLDFRYREAVRGAQLTIVTLQADPEDVLPGDIASRLHDGRFYRPWPPQCGDNPLVVERWGVRCLPGVLHIDGPDVRPYLRPDFVRQPPDAAR